MIQLSALCAASRLQVVRLTTDRAQQRRGMLPQTTQPLTHGIADHDGAAASKPTVLCEANTPLAPVQVAP